MKKWLLSRKEREWKKSGVRVIQIPQPIEHKLMLSEAALED
ncbi:hypothetical protein [Microcoleus sp. PH2017_28_MFU_U_A]|nr:hypothetical protein [Microcoleus sp. PH2017_28_MFU_U_A]